jgi:MerR family copper efflux transcriptional regulator
MEALTINEAAATTGWSPRMLRYVERIGILRARRSGAGYRLYGPAELQRLRTLRGLLDRFAVELGDMGFALRLRREDDLRAAVDAWFDEEARKPEHVPASDWMRWEQNKHQRLLAAAASPQPISEIA